MRSTDSVHVWLFAWGLGWAIPACRQSVTPDSPELWTAVTATPVSTSLASPESTPFSSSTPSENLVRSQADCPEDMVFVPGGDLGYPWLKQESFGDGTLADLVTQTSVAPFCIDKREVMDLALAQEKTCPHDPRGCTGIVAPLPATCVTLERAECYCTTLGRRLPTAAEWLFAAVGTTGNKFPWGDTWYPWGNDSHAGRPPEDGDEHFCERQKDPFKNGSPIAARQIEPNFKEFSSSQCTKYDATIDKSVYGVENMGSNVLELTSLTFQPKGGSRQCAVFGLDHTEYDPFSSPPSLVSAHGGLACDPNVSANQRALEHVGFRCVVSKKR